MHAATAHWGAADEELLEVARAEDRVLLTFDRGFGDIVFREGREAGRGVVLFRLGPLSAAARRVIVRSFFEADPVLSGSFTVVSPGQYRQRSLEEL